MLLYIALFLLILSTKAYSYEPFRCVKNTIYTSDPFENSTFKPECCPSSYSTSQGCLCVEENIYSLLASRGGNRKLDPFINTLTNS